MKWLIFKTSVNFILYVYHHKLIENFASKISKEIDSTFSHAIIILRRFEEAGLIEKENNDITKRTNFLKLTDKGKGVAENLDKLRMVLMKNQKCSNCGKENEYTEEELKEVFPYSREKLKCKYCGHSLSVCALFEVEDGIK